MFLKFAKLSIILAAFVEAMESAPLTSTSAPKFNFNFQWITRTAWHAAPARRITLINSVVKYAANKEGDMSSGVGDRDGDGVGVPYVIIHHTATRRCTTNDETNDGNTESCPKILRAIQRTHQQENNWDDIGYNFLIGGDELDKAQIYEGRGFNVSGAHTIGYNGRSIGIALIGNWTENSPPDSMLQKLKELIAYGIGAGYINENYKLLGHRQLSSTECPGRSLYNVLRNWHHFAEFP